MGEIVNKAKLAKILGKTEPTLTTWQKEGMPIKKLGERKGQSNTYDTAAVIDWLIKRSSDTNTAMEKAKLRLTEAQAEMEELKVLEKKEELIPLDKMKHLFSGVFASCRARILSMPSRLAPVIATHRDPKKIEKVLKEACAEALSDMANYDPETHDKTAHSRAGNAKGTRAAATA